MKVPEASYCSSSVEGWTKLRYLSWPEMARKEVPDASHCSSSVEDWTKLRYLSWPEMARKEVPMSGQFKFMF